MLDLTSGKQKKPVQATKPSKAIDSQKALLKTDPGSKKRKADSSTRVEGGDDLKALKARLSALEKENKQLKQNSVVTVARETSTSGDENVPSKKKKTKLDKSATGGEAGNKKSTHENDSASLSHEERKKKKALIKEKKRGEMVVKREARKQRKAEARVAREAGGAQLKQLQVENEDQRLVDVSAWKQFSLHPSLERALSIQVRFSSSLTRLAEWRYLIVQRFNCLEKSPEDLITSFMFDYLPLHLHITLLFLFTRASLSHLRFNASAYALPFATAWIS